MDSSTKIKYARFLYADFISDENEEKKIIYILQLLLKVFRGPVNKF